MFKKQKLKCVLCFEKQGLEIAASIWLRVDLFWNYLLFYFRFILEKDAESGRLIIRKIVLENDGFIIAGQQGL